MKIDMEEPKSLTPRDLVPAMRVYFNTPDEVIVASATQVGASDLWVVELIGEEGRVFAVDCDAKSKFTSQYIKGVDETPNDIGLIEDALKTALLTMNPSAAERISDRLDEIIGSKRWVFELINVSKNHNKFYRVKIDYNLAEYTYGAIGNAGRTNYTEYSSSGEALREVARVLRSKLSKGYVLAELRTTQRTIEYMLS